MTSLPDHPDLEQLRTQAKELKRALAAGDQTALDRVLASHPKFADRPADRADGWQFTLRDAQVTLARELGFVSWKALLENVEDVEERVRWKASASVDIIERAFDEAKKLKQPFCTREHFLLAILSPPKPTASCEVLNGVGLTYDQEQTRARNMDTKRRVFKGAGSTQAFQLILGWAQGIAIGLGASRVTDEHVLMALTYGSFGGDSLLSDLDIDPEDVIDGLRKAGVETPKLRPPATTTPVGPMGPFVYFPKQEFRSITEALFDKYPPGAVHWGTNASSWKKGYWYVQGEDRIPMEAIVRKALKGKSTNSIDVLTFQEGLELENAAAPRRYRARPSAGA